MKLYRRHYHQTSPRNSVNSGEKVVLDVSLDLSTPLEEEAQESIELVSFIPTGNNTPQDAKGDDPINRLEVKVTLF